jgi:hypothetical protein
VPVLNTTIGKDTIDVTETTNIADIITETTNTADIADTTNTVELQHSSQDCVQAETTVEPLTLLALPVLESVDRLSPFDSLETACNLTTNKDSSSSEESSTSESSKDASVEESPKSGPKSFPKKKIIKRHRSPLQSSNKASDELDLPKVVYLGFSVNDEIPSVVTLGPAPYDSAEGESYVFIGSFDSSD